MVVEAARLLEEGPYTAAVTPTDGMTADYYPFDHEFLGRVSTRIVNAASTASSTYHLEAAGDDRVGVRGRRRYFSGRNNSATASCSRTSGKKLSRWQ
jgi:hypothetical protein